MWQMGQSPGLPEVTVGCIGQYQMDAASAPAAERSLPPEQQTVMATTVRSAQDAAIRTATRIARRTGWRGG
jgi:hypothetical protein